MSKHDDLQVLVYKNKFWEEKTVNKSLKNALTYRHELEVPIIKGEGSFKKILGYVDYIINIEESACSDKKVEYLNEYNTESRCLNKNDDCKNYRCYGDKLRIGIELKTTKESLGETLRQITMYRTFMKFGRFYLIGDCMLEYKEILKDHNIFMIEEKEFKNL